MNINFVAPMNSLGYGVAARNLYRELCSRHEVALFPIGPIDCRGDEAPLVERGRLLAQEYDAAAPSVRIWHQDALAEHVGRGPRIGLTFFELSPLTAAAVHHMNAMDAVCVASHWAKGVAVDSGVDGRKLHVVPLGVDRTIFHEGVPADRLDPDQTVFFNAGKFEVRKGHDVLIRAFCRAFTPADRVVLRLLCDNPFLGPRNADWHRMYLDSPMGSRVEVHPRVVGQAAVAAFMAAGDVGVFPARAEGFNLDLLEAMSLGKHAIATNVAAHAEYCTPENCHLVDGGPPEPAYDGVWFRGEGDWASLGETQVDQLAGHMQELHARHMRGELGINEAGIATATRLSWGHSAARLEDAITAAMR